MTRAAASAGARLYFDVSYRLLAGSAAGRRVLALAAAGSEPVHGYFTAEDRDSLLADLDPGPDDLVLDLGCGLGGVAIELHRRSGARIVGVDLSRQAVSTATAQAQRAGLDGSVEFLVGDLAVPPRIGATKAHAIDSLMFVPDLVGTLAGIVEAIGPDGRLFATMLVIGSRPRDRIRGALKSAGASLQRLDNVTPALSERSRARANLAASLLPRRSTSLRGRMAMALVIAEEVMVRSLVALRLLSRWRFVVAFDSAYVPSMQVWAALDEPT